MFNLDEKEDISTQFASYLDINSKSGNKFTITSSMAQANRKIGAVDKT